MKRFLAVSLWPIVIVGSTVATYLGFASGYNLALVFFVVNVMLMAFVAVAEQVLPWRRDWNALTDRQSINDLAHAAIENQLGERLGDLVFLGIAGAASVGLTGALGWSLWPVNSPLILQVLLVTALGDALDYFKHRLLHTVPVLWRLHALHHGITQLHVFKAVRLHFTDLLMRFLIVYTPLVALGAPARVIFWYTAFISVFGLIGHANVDVRVPSVFHRVFMTPQVHRLHHSIERRLADTNYTNILPVWDIFFGTFSYPGDHSLHRVGVVGDPIPSDFLSQFLSPFIWSRLVEQANQAQPGT